jgi:hypothetical protein
MTQYTCDSCGGRTKEAGGTWDSWAASEAVSVTATRREINTLPGWDESRAFDPLAVHFCCEMCEERYVAQLFAKEMATKPEKRRARGTKRPRGRHAS